MKKLVLIFIISASLIPNMSFAHPGRTDSVGCHTCRTNCPNWGLDYSEYHCHRSKGVTQPKEPIRSIRNKDGVGKTVPAPEYKTPAKNTDTSTETPAPVKTEKPGTIKRFLNWIF